MSSCNENRKDHYGNNAVEAISTNQAFHVNGSVVTSDKTNTIVYNLIEGKLFNIETDQYELQIVGDQVFDVEKEQVVYNYQNNTFYNIEKKTEVLDWLQRDQLVLMIGLVLLTMLII